MPEVPRITSYNIFAISHRKRENEVHFLPANDHQMFLQTDTMPSHGKVTQNFKFSVSLQYLKKEVSDDADFLYADKHGRFLQIDTMICDGDCQ